MRRSTDALPLDIFRILTGLLAAAYIVRLLGEVPETMATAGLIDHRLVASLVPYVRLSCFQPGMSDFACYALLGLALACTVGIMLGWRPRWCAFVAWVITVSAARHAFLLIDIDDTIPELLLLWVVLLPVGRTLVWSEYRRATDKAALWQRWCGETVSGTVLWCFLGNLVLLYLVAGLTKYTSPMWRHGFGLYCSLELPLTRFYHLWTPADLSWLRPLNYLTLLVEPTCFPLMLALPIGSRLKYLGLSCQLGFHLVIAVLVGLPYANIGLLAALVLVFRHEIMQGVRGGVAPAAEQAPGLDFSQQFAVVLLALLTLNGLPSVGGSYEVSSVLLWIMGTQQDYHLFNWIDSYNVTVRNQVTVNGHEVPDSEFLPHDTRFAIVQCYLHGLGWIIVPPGSDAEMRRSLLQRLALRWAERHRGENGTCTVYSTEQRITPEQPTGSGGLSRLLVSFTFGGGGVHCLEPY